MSVQILVLVCFIFAVLLALIVFSTIVFVKQIDKLTTKLMTNDFREYSTHEQTLEHEKTMRMKPTEKKNPVLRI